MITFTNKLCWITGASSGIGKELAILLAKENAKLIISSHQKEELEEVKSLCLKYTTFCQSVVFDLSDSSEVEAAAQKVISEFGDVYLLINNGGVSQRSFVVDTSVELHRKIMEIDFFSYLILTKAVLPGMLAKGEGFIAATSSITGKFGFPLRSAYSAAKHAIQGFFETLRIEMLPHNISITVVYPGRVKTNISLSAVKSDGKPHGTMDPGQEGGISAEKCAVKYLRAIKKKKPEVLIGGKELLPVYIKRFLPRLFFKMVSKIKAT